MKASEGKFETDYTKFLNANGLARARIGIPRAFFYDRTPSGRGLFTFLPLLARTAISTTATTMPTITKAPTAAAARRIGHAIAEFSRAG